MVVRALLFLFKPIAHADLLSPLGNAAARRAKQCMPITFLVNPVSVAQMTCTTDWPQLLSTLANVAQVVTGVVAGFLGLSYVRDHRVRKSRLENYLKAVKADDAKGTGVFELGRRTIAHLMAHLAMTEAQVLEAGFGNPKKVKSFPATDDKTGRAETLYFQYIGDEKSN